MANKKSKKGYQTQRPTSQGNDEAAEQFQLAYQSVLLHPIFAGLMHRVHIYRKEQDNLCPREGWAVVTSNGVIHVHPKRSGSDAEWICILSHCLLHLAFEHFQQRANPLAWNVACDVYVTRFLQDMNFGHPPEEMRVRVEGFPRDEDSIYRQFCEDGIPESCQVYSTGGVGTLNMILEPDNSRSVRTVWNKQITWKELFGQGLTNAVSRAVEYAAGETESTRDWSPSKRTEAQRAWRWFLNKFPLLGALAAGFKIVESVELCQKMQISVAAVDAEAREIYISPAAGLMEEECKFVIAHELLHVALRHHARRQGRDPFLWNVACDYVINQWLVEMGVGDMPQFGLLFDPTLKGMNAEAIYDLIVNDLRRYRKLCTLRGIGMGDMLEPLEADWWLHGHGLSLDEFYRRALAQGLTYHQSAGRGFLPAGLIEEIMAISQPPIPWDVELARWFDAHFPPLEKIRTYARPSRRQSATPDIPRASYVPDVRDIQARTFGVVLDTSGSMEKTLLAKALGAIASYSLSHDVGMVRVVFCDAAPYDQGYMSAEDIAGRVKVRGRGGTILQPGIRLLENADDFPPDGPILIITDTYCDNLTARRSHAYLIPVGKRLPFAAKGPVFYIR